MNFALQCAVLFHIILKQQQKKNEEKTVVLLDDANKIKYYKNVMCVQTTLLSIL